jgi:hypothetical protein
MARGVKLPPLGSVEDRILREQIFRERREKVAHLEAMTKIVAQVLGLDAPRVFGSVVRDYTREVFQETYDAELLRNKITALRKAQEQVKAKKQEDNRMLDRLNKMGEFYEKQNAPIGAPPKAPQPVKAKP